MNEAVSRDCDVAVIGGGLAGAAAAVLLARQGVSTLLLEKESGPHHKVCGEFISYEAQHYLTRLGIDLKEHGAVPIDRLRLVRGQKSATLPLGFQALSLSRYLLDQIVLRQAGASGAVVRTRTTVTGMSNDGTGWHVACQDGDPVQAKAIFLATGKHEVRGWSRPAETGADYIGFKMHFRSATVEQHRKISRTVIIALFPGGYAGLEPIEDSSINLCLVVTKRQFALCNKSWKMLLERLMRVTPVLAECLEGATPCWDRPLAIFGIPYGYVYAPATDEALNLFRLGDQMAVIPSLCGDGMAIALHTGFLAAHHYAQDNALSYHLSARLHLRPQIDHAMRIARLLTMPGLQPFVLPVSLVLPGLVSYIIATTRLRQIVQA